MLLVAPLPTAQRSHLALSAAPSSIVFFWKNELVFKKKLKIE